MNNKLKTYSFSVLEFIGAKEDESEKYDLTKRVDDLPDDPKPGERAYVKFNMFRTGSFEHPWYGKLDFDKDYLNGLVNNFKAGVVGRDLHMDLDHNRAGETRSYGVIKELTVEPGKVAGALSERDGYFLSAIVELNSLGIKIVKDRQYSYCSSEIAHDYSNHEIEELPYELLTKEEKEEGNTAATFTYGPTMVGCAFTNRPFIPGLGEVVSFSEGIAEHEKGKIVLSEKQAGIQFFSLADKSFKKDLDFSPPNGVREAAQQGLDYRKEYGRGGTEVAIARARDLSNGSNVSADTVRRMKAFFDRHQKNRVPPSEKKQPDGGPTNGWIAWQMWGGDPGRSWAEKLVGQMNREEEANMDDSDSRHEVTSLNSDDENLEISQTDKSSDKDFKNEQYNQRDSAREEAFKELKRVEKKGDKMKLAELIKRMREFSTVKEQLDFLEIERAASEDDVDTVALDALIEAKKGEHVQEVASQEFAQRQARFEAERQRDLEEKARLRRELAEAREGEWTNRVKSFASQLRSENHHESLVKAVEDKLGKLVAESRKHQFSFINDDSEEKHTEGLIDLLTEIFSSIPESARLDFSEQTDANASVGETEEPVSPEGVEESVFAEEDGEAEEQGADETEAKIAAYKARYKNQEPYEYQLPFINPETGHFDVAACLASRKK